MEGRAPRHAHPWGHAHTGVNSNTQVYKCTEKSLTDTYFIQSPIHTQQKIVTGHVIRCFSSHAHVHLDTRSRVDTHTGR